MVVVAIVAILTLVAYPAYQSFVVKSNRAEAKSYLMHLAQSEQLYFNDTRTYADDVIELQSPVPNRVAANYDVTAADFFTVAAGPPPTFTIKLAPKVGSQQEGDGDLTIANTGEKLHAGEPW